MHSDASSCNMPGFRWDISHDIALCVEVVKSRPQKPAEWEQLASTLNTQFLAATKDVKARGCKERLQLLLKKHKQNDARALKRYELVYVS